MRFLTPLIVAWLVLLQPLSAQARVAVDKPLSHLPKTFTIIIGQKSYPVKKDVLHTWFRTIPTLSYHPGTHAEIENTTICPVVLEPCDLRLSLRARNAITITDSYVPNVHTITDYIVNLEHAIGTQPRNARLGITNGVVTVVAPHKNGIGINVDTAVKQIVTALYANQQSVTLDFDEQQATVRSDNYKQLGLVERIGEGVSDFSGSTLSRIHNIKTAAEKFDGILIAPGEEFSFVEHLGPVDGEHGFKKELVIKDNQTKPEYGGGICQVSTTVFRSAILTGLKITQRRNHSYPVHYYYPTGFDATVYVPQPDLRFKNNTSHYIMLHMMMDVAKKELIFQIYGTKDGRHVKMVGPVVTERHPDGSMKTYFTQTVTDANGKTIIDDVFRSNYRSPKDYPQPGQEVQKFTTKPKNWSKKQWKAYKATNGL